MNTEKITRKEMHDAVRAYVLRERLRRGITELSTKELPEGSCEGSGEFFNFVEVQLLYTAEPHGGWKELDDDSILEGAYLYVVTGKRG